MVSIFTYRDERKLFAVIGAIIVAAVIVLIQLEAARNGRPGAITVAVQSVAVWLETGVSTVANGLRGGAGAIASIPRLSSENAALRAKVSALQSENRKLAEALAQLPDAQGLIQAQQDVPDGVAARVVGYDPESVARTVTVNRGSHAGVRLQAGVVSADGVVGRVLAATPFAATVQLLTDATSKVPAVVQRRRWWGIATGVPQSAQIALEYVSQDAKLRVGDAVVTGEGRSFHAGLLIGHIAKIYYPQGALYQTAILTPAVRFGRIDRVLILRSDDATH